MLQLETWLRKARLDGYVLLIMGMVVLASVLPARGVAAVVFDHVTDFAIALLFFLYGGRLSREAVMAGVSNWRLQLFVLACTYVVFPLAGLGVAAVARPSVDPIIGTGILFLCLLPSTVQSSIAFTSIARGDVPSAVCAASLSNLAGVVVTPMLVGLFLTIPGTAGASGGSSLHAVKAVVVQLFLPFALGQLLRPWIAEWLLRNKAMLSYVDRGSILLVVYTAFSEGVVNGIWQRVDLVTLGIILGAACVLLAIMLGFTVWTSRRLGFAVEQETAIVFCGSKKSLASGVPMANILFPGSIVGIVVLPLMLFHQIQLMVCAAMATKYAERAK
ncbi:bile acid:sodium symporter [Bryobacterales bacterium F-183]|nr:bile acid:sodium symporter [Bryobacterales bacterium F-183]